MTVRVDRRQKIFQKVLDQIDVVPCLDPKLEDCWIWLGGDSGNGRGGGYPRMNLNGQTVAVHRVMFTHEYGYIPGKKQVDHKCRNRLCVNPKHLELVTHKQNQRRRDAANKGKRDG